MKQEYRVLRFDRGVVEVQPLDGYDAELVRIPSPQKYIENEILRLEMLDAGHAAPPSPRSAMVIAARLEPTFIGERLPSLQAVDENEYMFEDDVPFGDMMTFDGALDRMDAGQIRSAASILRELIFDFPYFIDAYHHLGIIDERRGRRSRAMKYFEMGYRIGELILPKDFEGRLPWDHDENRPFLRAAHGFALSLEQRKRYLEAKEVFERILRLNPNDNQGVRYLLPNVLLHAKAPSKAREFFESRPPDSMNLFTRCLLEIQDGREQDALRWLCRALAYNHHLPHLVLTAERYDEGERPPYFAVGSREEAVDYLRTTGKFWRVSKVRGFLSRALAAAPLKARLERALALEALLRGEDGLPPGERRSSVVGEIHSLFDEPEIGQIVAECAPLL